MVPHVKRNMSPRKVFDDKRYGADLTVMNQEKESLFSHLKGLNVSRL